MGQANSSSTDAKSKIAILLIVFATILIVVSVILWKNQDIPKQTSQDALIDNTIRLDIPAPELEQIVKEKALITCSDSKELKDLAKSTCSMLFNDQKNYEFPPSSKSLVINGKSIEIGRYLNQTVPSIKLIQALKKQDIAECDNIQRTDDLNIDLKELCKHVLGDKTYCQNNQETPTCQYILTEKVSDCDHLNIYLYNENDRIGCLNLLYFRKSYAERNPTLCENIYGVEKYTCKALASDLKGIDECEQAFIDNICVSTLAYNSVAKFYSNTTMCEKIFLHEERIKCHESWGG